MKKIETLIEAGDFENAEKWLERYEQIHTQDPEIYTYHLLCELYKEDYIAACEYGKKAVQTMPYSADVHYNYGMVSACAAKWMEAYEHYAIAVELCDAGIEGHFDIISVKEEMEEIRKCLEEYLKQADDSTTALLLDKISYIRTKSRYQWGISYNLFHSNRNSINLEYRDYEQLPSLYLGVGSETTRYIFECTERGSGDVTEYMTELQRVSNERKTAFIINQKESFVSLLSNTEQNITIKDADNQKEIVTVKQADKHRFVNYRMPVGNLELSAPNPFRIGNMIPIEHKPDRKRLVLNIFVDGLSQYALSGRMGEYMPYTKRFFEKGMVCTNAYTIADWTFPSIAGVVTGQTMVKHKMLHSRLHRTLDADTPILYEYFKAKGYNTTKIGGNWRITPNYGYARGMDRIFYQHMYAGYTAERVVSDVIEQIYHMRETDQFIWMEIGELHKIADEYDFGMLMTEFPIEEVQNTKDNINSVKQEYDETKIKYYLEQAKQVDRKLAALYQYIEEHYSEDEILVSIFSDHGQGYLIPPNEEFLSDGRSKVVFMVRGNGVTGETDELISIADYSAIMCEMAGIAYNYDNTDAHLPKAFGGTTEREFAITESIHVGDPYQISLKGKDFTFYLKGSENVTNDCRVPLGNVQAALLDKNGEKIEDSEKMEHYTRYCLDHVAPCLIYED